VKYDCSVVDVVRYLYETHSPRSAENFIFVYRMDKENDNFM